MGSAHLKEETMSLKLEHGMKARIAALAGLTPQMFNDVLAQRKWCPRRKVQAVHDALLEAAGIEVPVVELANSKLSDHPIFGSKPRRVNRKNDPLA